jgi:hypothetical protein
MEPTTLPVDVCAHLSANLPGCWIGHASHNDSSLLPWPPWSPDLTPCDFFLWGYIKNHVFTCLLCHVIYHSCDKGSWRQSLLSTARCCNLCGKNLITGLTSATSTSTCTVGQKLGVSLSLLTCCPLAWPSRLYRRGRQCRRDLQITLYFLSELSYKSMLLVAVHPSSVSLLYPTEWCITNIWPSQYLKFSTWCMKHVLFIRKRYNHEVTVFGGQ